MAPVVFDRLVAQCEFLTKVTELTVGVPEYDIDELVYASPLEKAYGLSPEAYAYYCRMQKALDRFNLHPTVDVDAKDALSALESRVRALRHAGYDVFDGGPAFDEFVIDFVHSTATIEGSTLSVHEVAALLSGGEHSGEAIDIRQKDEIEDIESAFAFAMQRVRERICIDMEYVREVHEIAAGSLEDADPGIIRTDQRYLTGTSGVLPPPPEMVTALLEDAIAWYNDSPTLERAIGFHALFEDIHPFRDGNGRTGRVMLNGMLAALGCPPVALKCDASSRLAYREAIHTFANDIEHRDFSDLASMVIDRALLRIDEAERSFGHSKE